MGIRSANEALSDILPILLTGERSVDLIQYDRYLFYVFSDDWLHQAVGAHFRGITDQVAAGRIAAGKAVEMGQYSGDGRLCDEKLFQVFASFHSEVAFVDVGANYGRESIRLGTYAKSIGVNVSVHVLIEPAHAGLLAPVNMVLHGLGNALVVYAALGNRDGLELFYFKPNVTTGGTMLPNQSQWKAGLYQSVPVQVCRWDTLSQKLNVDGPTFFKIDVQGFESLLFEGASDFVQRNPCAGICEFSPLAMRQRGSPVSFLERLRREFRIWDAGLDRKKAQVVGDDLSAFVANVQGREKPWTDLIFAPQDLDIELS